MLAPLLAGLLLGACDRQAQESVAGTLANSNAGTARKSAVAVEKGMFFKPGLIDFSLHNEYDDDGDGDGVNETRVSRYISENGDTAFSMTTAGRVWAWSLDARDADDTDVHRHYVIRDSNCDGVFDERYSLSAEFHVPGCLAEDSRDSISIH